MSDYGIRHAGLWSCMKKVGSPESPKHDQSGETVSR